MTSQGPVPRKAGADFGGLTAETPLGGPWPLSGSSCEQPLAGGREALSNNCLKIDAAGSRGNESPSRSAASEQEASGAGVGLQPLSCLHPEGLGSGAADAGLGCWVPAPASPVRCLGCAEGVGESSWSHPGCAPASVPLSDWLGLGWQLSKAGHTLVSQGQ